jgi:hypothetical protein
MSRISLLLSGGRGQWPNIWSVRAFAPEVVYILPPTGDQVNTDRLIKWLRQESISHQLLPPVDPGDSVAAYNVCKEIISAHTDDELLVNLTQAPKMTAIGASFAAIEAYRVGQNVCAFNVDTARKKLNVACGNPPIVGDIQPTIEDYLSAYGRSGRPSAVASQSTPVDVLSPLLRKFAQNPYLIRKIASTLSGAKDPAVCRGVHPVRLPDYLRTAPMFQMLSVMVGQGVLADIDKVTGQICVANNSMFKFVTGGWLEKYVYQEALKCEESDHAQMFSECAQGLFIKNETSENEIDVVCLDTWGFVMLASCKSGSLTKSPHIIDEIMDRAKLLGDSYCAKALVTTTSMVRVPAALKIQARDRRVEIYSSEDLPSIKSKFEQLVCKARLSAR